MSDASDDQYDGPCPVVMPEPEELLESAYSAPIFEKFRMFAAFIGKGRKLTQRGNLRLADARDLIDLLGTDDVMDEVIGGRQFKTYTSVELVRVNQIFLWAKKAGVIRVRNLVAIATKRGRECGRNPIDDFDRVFEALIKLGPLYSLMPYSRFEFRDEVSDFLDAHVAEIHYVLYQGQRPESFESIARRAAAVVLETIPIDERWTEREVITGVEYDISDMIDTLELAGVLMRSGFKIDPERRRAARRGGEVALTPIGVRAIRRLFQSKGFEAPVGRDLGNITAADLVKRIGTGELIESLQQPVTLAPEAVAWINGQTPEEAAVAFATAVVELDNEALRTIAFVMLSLLPIEATEPLVRDFLHTPRLRREALAWLIKSGVEPPGELHQLKGT